ncbi:MAG: hypothetical protein ACFFE8_17435 [Candidatus Heimdallarchaeota archaeon]
MALHNQPIYPIKPTNAEYKIIQDFLNIVRDNLGLAIKEREKIMLSIGRPTNIFSPRIRRNWFGLFSREKYVFEILKKHMYEAVLAVSLRFPWKPEEILALWQMEGLPSSGVLPYEQEKPGKWSPFPYHWYHGKSPKNEDEARSWARSGVLYERWGLDRLAPIRRGQFDNELQIVSKTSHDKSFNDGFNKECSHHLNENPLSYLSSKSGPIEIKKTGRNWLFRTSPEYQPTMLSIQHARFLSQRQRIPISLDFGGIQIFTRSVFPALLYLYFNSRHSDKYLKNGIAKRMIRREKEKKTKKEEYDGNDLYNFYINNPIPKDIESWVDKVQKETGRVNGHAYVNALRFEYLRQVYSKVFDGIGKEIDMWLLFGENQ